MAAAGKLVVGGVSAGEIERKDNCGQKGKEVTQMPGGDRTGPLGQGPMTGSGFGYCSGSDRAGAAYGPGRGFGRGYGRGFGRSFGRGYGRGFRGRGMMPAYGWNAYAPPAQPMSTEEEANVLKAQAQQLQETLDQIKNRLDELDK